MKSALAHLVLGADLTDHPGIGSVRLRPHQAEGAVRVMDSFEKFHGALLCDRVGMGKTFTAAAVMRRFSFPVVVAPAALEPMWKSELLRAGIAAVLHSHETFSRHPVTVAPADLVVVDEAHHFRNPRTHRFRNLAAFIGRAHALLLTATPVHNSRNEAVTLLSLFLGPRAPLLSASEFAQCVIRRNAPSQAGFPRRIHCRPECPSLPEEIRREILSLPPPLPARDGDDCSALIRFTLLRQWASSDAALRAGLKRRLARARALMDALEQGTYPTRKQLEAWLTGDLDVQLAFPRFLADAGGDSELLGAVRRHEAATARLYAALDRNSKSDSWRVGYVRELRRKYPDRSIVVFTQFAATASHLFSAMKSDAGVALITAQRCEIASGPVNREYVIRRFAPRATGVRSPPHRESVTMLIATDLCSEGLNLQDASVIVHMDMPWTPARLEQRIGRVARPGGSRREVFIHTVDVPLVADDILRMMDRLRQKSQIAGRIVGCDQAVPPEGDAPSIPEAAEQVLRVLKEWERRFSRGDETVHCTFAQVDAAFDCFVAAVSDGTTVRLAAGHGGNISDDPRRVLRVLKAFSSSEMKADQRAADEIVLSLHCWLTQETLQESLGVRRSDAAARRTVIRKIEAVTSHLPNHARAEDFVLADSARRAVAGRFTAAGQLRLSALGRAQSPDAEWLRQIISAAEAPDGRKAGPVNKPGPEVLALLMGRKN